MLPQTAYTIRSRTWPVWILFGMTALPGTFLMMTSPADKDGALLFFAGCLLSLFGYGLGKSFSIYLDDEVLVFKAIGRKRTMHWTNMKATSLNWSAEGGHGASYHWDFESFKNKQLHIPLGYYSRADRKLLAKQTVDRAKNATIAPSIHRLAEGRFPWYLF